MTSSSGDDAIASSGRSRDDKPNEMKEMMDKFNKYAKQVKLVLTKLEEIDKKIGTAMTVKNVDADDEKEKMDKIFKAKSIGRPVGSYETKQKQYLNMLNEHKIKQPKSATTEYYRIVKDGDKYKLMD